MKKIVPSVLLVILTAVISTTVAIAAVKGDPNFFSDADYNGYYAKGLDKMSSWGVVKGYEGTDKFGPNDIVTRAQLVTILDRFNTASVNPNAQNALNPAEIFDITQVLCYKFKTEDFGSDVAKTGFSGADAKKSFERLCAHQ